MNAKTTLPALMLLLCCYTIAQAQVPASQVLAKLVESGSDKKKHKANRSFAAVGIRLHAEALAKDSLVFEFDDISQLKGCLPKNRYGMALSHYSPTTPQSTTQVLRLKKKALLALLYAQWLAKREIAPEDASSENKRYFKKLFKAKKKMPRLLKKERWQVYLGKASDLLPVEANESWRIEFLRGRRWYGLLYADTVQSDIAYDLPNFTIANCGSCNRYQLLFNVVKADFEQLAYSPFVPRGEMKRTRTFTLRFNKNEINYDTEDVQEIIEFLQDSNYTVHKALIRGYASVEGDSLNNRRLMEARANVLMGALNAQNDGDSIELGLITEENWSLFDKQLKKGGYDTTTSREEWRSLFLNDSIEEAMEPLLAKQRKAELKLFVSLRLQPQQKVSLALALYRKYVRRYALSRNNQSRFKTLGRLMAIRAWLKAEVIAGRLEEDALCSLDPLPDNLWAIYRLYDLSVSMKRGEPVFCDSPADLIREAHGASMYLLRQYPENPTYLKHLRDVQVITFEMIKSGQVVPEVLCDLSMPDEPLFYEFTIAQLYFVSREVPYKYLSNPCERLSMLLPDHGLQLYASANTALSPPADDIRANNRGAYYYLLKKRVLEGVDIFADYTNRPEGQLFSFDLFEFLEHNIRGWQAEQDSLFDPEVSPEEMEKQLRRLLRNPGPICPTDLDEIALRFHRKVLIHTLKQQQSTELSINSIRSIGSYYSRHAAKLSELQATEISAFLLAANGYCYQQEGAMQALAVLDGFFNKNPGTPALRKTYYRLLLLVSRNAGRKLLSAILESKDPIMRMGTGKDNLPLVLIDPRTQQTLHEAQADLLSTAGK